MDTNAAAAADGRPKNRRTVRTDEVPAGTPPAENKAPRKARKAKARPAVTEAPPVGAEPVASIVAAEPVAPVSGRSRKARKVAHVEVAVEPQGSQMAVDLTIREKPAAKEKKAKLSPKEKEAAKRQKEAEAEDKAKLAAAKKAAAQQKKKEDALANQAYPHTKGTPPGGYRPVWPDAHAENGGAGGVNALVRVTYRTPRRTDETVYMVRGGGSPIDRAHAEVHGTAVATRSDAAAEGHWVATRDARFWAPTVAACRMAPRVCNDVLGPDADDVVEVVVPAPVEGQSLSAREWVLKVLLKAHADAEGGSWRAMVPKSKAALAIGVLGMTGVRA